MATKKTIKTVPAKSREEMEYIAALSYWETSDPRRKSPTWFPTGKFRDPPYHGGTCPRCGAPLPWGFGGALSRIDNETEICPPCGTREALEGIGRSR